MIGMNTSPTSESTILPKAAPMITPMARSTTLPRNANCLNSLSMRALPGQSHRHAEPVFGFVKRNGEGASGSGGLRVGPRGARNQGSGKSSRRRHDGQGQVLVGQDGDHAAVADIQIVEIMRLEI